MMLNEYRLIHPRTIAWKGVWEKPMIKLITIFLTVGAIGLLVVGCTDENTTVETTVTGDVVPEVVPSGDAGRRLLFQLRCDEGHGGMCGELALMYKKGYGGIKSASKAMEFYKKACDLGVEQSCVDVGVELSWEKELEIVTRDCEKGNPFSCNNMGYILWMGKGVKHDLPEARKALTKACDGGYSASCRGLAKMWNLGLGGEKDEKKATEYVAKAKKALEAEEALKAKYLHMIPTDKLPVGKPRKGTLERPSMGARSRQAE
jgi:hypothetical protein